MRAPPTRVISNVSMIELIHEEIANLIKQKNYPCVPAVQSVAQKEYLVEIYGKLGSGQHASLIAKALSNFRRQQIETKSPFLSFWAVFPESKNLTEEEFEVDLWKELSFLAAQSDPALGWDSEFSSDPADPKFCFSFEGEAFFVVGLHPQSSRKARQFPFPTLIFNRYEQFKELMRQGRYETLVKQNRQRDLKFQGSINPMVEKYGEEREAIQFSGKANSSDWKCPFHHL